MADTTSLQLSKLLNKTLNYEKTISSSRLIKLFTATDDIHDIDVTLTINSDEFVSFNAINGNFFIKINNQNSILNNAKIGYINKGYYLYLSSTSNSFIAKISLKINNGAVNIESILTAEGYPSGVSFTKELQLTSFKTNKSIVDELVVSKLRNEENSPNHILLSDGSTIEKSDLLGEVQDNDTYPSNLYFSTTGEKLYTELNNNTTLETDIPSATETTGGMVTTSSQTFAGEKTFKNNIITEGTITVNNGIYRHKTIGIRIVDDLSNDENLLLECDYNGTINSSLYDNYIESVSITTTTGATIDDNISENNEEEIIRFNYTGNSSAPASLYAAINIKTDKKSNTSSYKFPNRYFMQNLQSIKIHSPAKGSIESLKFGYWVREDEDFTSSYLNDLTYKWFQNSFPIGTNVSVSGYTIPMNQLKSTLSEPSKEDDFVVPYNSPYVLVVQFDGKSDLSFNITITSNNGRYGETETVGAQHYQLTANDEKKFVIIKTGSDGETEQFDNRIDFKQSVYTSDGVAVTSDERDKINFEPLDERALKLINSVETYTFNSNNREKYLINENEYDIEEHKKGTKQGKRRKVGVKAQEVYKLMKDIYNDNNYASIVDYTNYKLISSEKIDKYYVRYESFIPFLIKSIQLQQDQIESLNQTVLALQEEINSLKNSTSEVVETQEIITEE